MLYWGRDRKRYELGARIGGGGEGDVYEIVGHADKLAKIYKPFASAAERADKRDKLRAMLAMNLPSGVGGKILLAWPLDTLSDQKGEFCGYVMPRVKNKKALYCAVLPSERTTLFGSGYSWALMPRLAYNLASMVETLHDLGVVIGDLNADNFLVDRDGYITLIDADSYTITWQGRTYKCKGAMSDVLAPELQGKDLRRESSVFTKESDCFGLAVHLWQILNNGVHPFSLPPRVKSSACFNPAVTNIASGYSVLTRRGQKNSDQPSLNMLPDYIMGLFERMFVYDARTACRPETIRNRPSAAEFVSALERLIQEPVKKCRKTAKHVYLSSSRRCPWCEIERRKTQGQKTVCHQGKTPPLAMLVLVPLAVIFVICRVLSGM